MKSITKISAVILLVSTLSSSCNKDYTCECKVLGNNTSETWKNIKSSEAQDSCAAANSAAISYGGSCSLKQ